MLHAIDWLILIVPMLAIFVVALSTRRWIRGVADFMTGGRAAGRYLVAVEDGMSTTGLITILALMEFAYSSGFTVSYWRAISIPVALMLTLTGFVIFRFRETRAMTMAQFFEMRYSRGFRVLAGVIGAISGLVNYGLFPAVSSRFFVTYCGLPQTVEIFSFTIPMFALLMAGLLTVSVTMTISGGVLTIMLVDYLQGMWVYLCCIVLAVTVFCLFRWDQITQALASAPQGNLIDPFSAHTLEDFNLTFVMIGVFAMIYGRMAWQGSQGSNAAAASPHEAKMGQMLGTWRQTALLLMVTLLSLAAFTVLHHPDFAAQAIGIQQHLATIENPAIRTQQQVPVVLSHILPIGVSGAFLAVMAFTMITTDTACLHSWGGIIIQDIVLPFRKKPFTPAQQLRILRLSIIGVAIFAFCFGVLFTQTTYIFMFFALTGAIYIGGAGACIVGGLYWRRGTTAGAWAALVTGVSIALMGFAITHGWHIVQPWLLSMVPDSAFLARHAAKPPVNGQVMFFYAMIGGTIAYVTGSLLTSRKPFDLDALLNRNKPLACMNETAKPSRWVGVLGITPSFSRNDRRIAYAVFGWSMMLFAAWLIPTLWNFVRPWAFEAWRVYFLIFAVIVPFIASVTITIVFAVGGFKDVRRMFQRLRETPVDHSDDGRVIRKEQPDPPRLDERRATESPSEPESASPVGALLAKPST